MKKAFDDINKGTAQYVFNKMAWHIVASAPVFAVPIHGKNNERLKVKYHLVFL